jgi:hypothetical protein
MLFGVIVGGLQYIVDCANWNRYDSGHHVLQPPDKEPEHHETGSAVHAAL